MINHARTLLLNLDGSTSPGSTYPGEEFVPAGYRAVQIPNSLERVRSILLGISSDRALKNYRLRQLLNIVHSTSLGDYLIELDPRITYWPSTDTTLLRSALYGPTAVLLDGSPSWALSVLNYESEKSDNKLYEQWRLQVLSSSSLKITRETDSVNEQTTTSYSAGNGVSAPITLPSSRLQVTISAGILGAGNWPTWKLNVLSKPLFGLSDVYLTLKHNIESDVDSLFVDASEPYNTCRLLWSMEQGPIVYKLGAVLVALAYQLNKIYQQSDTV